MTEDEDAQNAFEDLLRKMFGDEGGEEAARALRDQGFDPSQLPPQFLNPAALNTAFSQFQFLMNTSTGPVDWRIVTDTTRQLVYKNGDPQLSAAQAQQARHAMTVADLWIDTVTDFEPGPLTRHAWTRSQWFDATLPMWKRFTEPVARNVSRALGEVIGAAHTGTDITADVEDNASLPSGLAQMLSKSKELVPKVSAMMFAAQIARALTGLATEALGSTDVGIPLVEGGTTSLIVSNIEAFADGLDIPFDEVLHFIAVRECAHRRLFQSVPWLSGDLVRAVENYAERIAIDDDAISQAVHSFNPGDPDSLESAFSSGVFAIGVTEEQRRSLDRLETILALVEGWVEVVTARAVAPYLPHADQLREMLRRRRVGGSPAEQVLGDLIGLQMRPRRARAAAKIFDLVESDGGANARDALWSHPDMVPTIAELDSPESFLVMRQAAGQQDADIDAALAALLDGTMGWAEGVTPDLDPESQTLAKAGFAPSDEVPTEGENSEDTSAEDDAAEGDAAEDNGAEAKGVEGAEGNSGEGIEDASTGESRN